jgi:membrane-bound lytic murein transglycosylase D
MEERIPMTTPPTQQRLAFATVAAPARWWRAKAATLATSLLLLACVSTPLPPSPPFPSSDAPPPAFSMPAVEPIAGKPAAAATPAAEDEAGAVAVSEAASAVPLAAGEEPSKAAGQPSDPLRPEAVLSLEDEAARRDLWQRIRRGFAMPDLDTQLVRGREQWYAERPDYVQRMTDRGSRYLFHIVEEVERRGMPTELALLPFIESAFNPEAMSVARASGMWQFIPSTGRMYDLTQNVFRDDRRDVLASTRAALDYLERLYGMFGDWHLALAAYNWGEGSVQRAMARNQRLGKPTDYLSLNMPAETRLYVPKLQAVENIIANPQNFGLVLPQVQNHPYFIAVPIERDIDAAVAARLAELPLDEFKTLNPSLNKPVILAAGTPQLLLPYDSANVFLQNLKNHKGPLASWTAWVLPKTSRTAQVAQQVGMSEAQLREINHIPPGMLVKAGSTLLVPRQPSATQDVSERLADTANLSLAPDGPVTRRVVFKARKGETVRTVARRYGVPVARVAAWNQVGTNAAFARGQSVTVFLAVKAPGKRSAKRTATRPGRATAVASDTLRPARPSRQ